MRLARTILTGALGASLLAASSPASVPAAEGRKPPAHHEALTLLQESFNTDRQPPDFSGFAGRMPSEKYEQLRNLRAWIITIQSGFGFYTPKTTKLIKDFKTPAAAEKLYLERSSRSPSPAELRRIVQAACRYGYKNENCLQSNSHWCAQYRNKVGPVLDQLGKNPAGPLRLPQGHPYAKDMPVIACRPQDEPLAAKSAEIDKELDRLVNSPDTAKNTLRKLSTAYRDAERLARAAESLECRNARHTWHCSEAERKVRLYRSMGGLFEQAQTCMQKPEDCGGLACDLSTFCALPRSAAVYANTPTADNLLDLQAEIFAASTLVLGPAHILARLPAKLAYKAAVKARRGGSVPSSRVKADTPSTRITAAQAQGRPRGPDSPANRMNADRLYRRLVAQSIAEHAYKRHVIEKREFPWITSPNEFTLFIERILNNPTEVRNLVDKTGKTGKTAYWDSATKTIVIHNPRASDKGTAFVPINGKKYLEQHFPRRGRTETFDPAPAPIGTPPS